MRISNHLRPLRRDCPDCENIISPQENSFELALVFCKMDVFQEDSGFPCLGLMKLGLYAALDDWHVESIVIHAKEDDRPTLEGGFKIR